MPSALFVKSGSPWTAALLAAAIAMSYVPAASAATAVYDLTQSFCSSSCGSGPFGTVTVTSVSSTEVHVSVVLAPSEVFAVTGAGSALLFDLAGNPTISISGLTPGFTASGTASGQSTHAGGTGYWQYGISCTACGNGTSAPRYSGPLSFNITVPGGITPASFVQNGKSLFFATDIGVLNATGGGFSTGDVGAVRPVPLPAAAWLLVSGLACLTLFARKRRTV